MKKYRRILEAVGLISLLTVGAVSAQGTFPVELGYSPCKKATTGGKPALNVYMAPGATHIRGIVLVMENTIMYRIATYRPLWQLAQSQQLAVVYLRCGEIVGSVEKGGPQVQAILDTIAEVTKIPDFKHAPWLPFGLSSVGAWPYNLAFRYPERTIGGVTWHGAVPPPPGPSWARIESGMPYLCIVGEQEWKDPKIAPDGHWKAFVRPGLLYWRRQGWLTSMVAGYKVDHGDYSKSPYVSEEMAKRYMTDWVEAAVKARVPSDTFATTGPVTLKKVDPASGFLLDPDLECMMYPDTPCIGERVRPYAEVPESRRDSMFWTFNRNLADNYVRLHTGHLTSSLAPQSEGNQAFKDIADVVFSRGNLLITPSDTGPMEVRVGGVDGKTRFHTTTSGKPVRWRNGNRDRQALWLELSSARATARHWLLNSP